MGVRKCSKCGQTGHNSRTCRNLSSRKENCGKIMKLFGVEFTKLPSSDDGFGIKSLGFSPTEISSSDEDSDKLKHIGPTQVQRKKGTQPARFSYFTSLIYFNRFMISSNTILYMLYNYVRGCNINNISNCVNPILLIMFYPIAHYIYMFTILKKNKIF